MFNYCVLSGRVITDPTLRFYGKDSPVTEFTLNILMGNRRWGTIKVSTFSSLAMGAAKHLRHGRQGSSWGLHKRGCTSPGYTSGCQRVGAFEGRSRY
jgi:hypothetical protein